MHLARNWLWPTWWMLVPLLVAVDRCVPDARAALVRPAAHVDDAGPTRAGAGADGDAPAPRDSRCSSPRWSRSRSSGVAAIRARRRRTSPRRTSSWRVRTGSRPYATAAVEQRLAASGTRTRSRRPRRRPPPSPPTPAVLRLLGFTIDDLCAPFPRTGDRSQRREQRMLERRRKLALYYLNLLVPAEPDPLNRREFALLPSRHDRDGSAAPLGSHPDLRRRSKTGPSTARSKACTRASIAWSRSTTSSTSAPTASSRVDDADVTALEAVLDATNELQAELRPVATYLYAVVSTDSRDDVAAARHVELQTRAAPLAALGEATRVRGSRRSTSTRSSRAARRPASTRSRCARRPRAPSCR